MAIRDRMEDVRKAALVAAAEENTRARMKEWATAGLYFLIGFLMSAARLAGGAAPFGVAAVAQAGHKLPGACALCGAIMGYLATGGVEWGVKYAAACVLVFTVGFVLQDIKLSAREWFMPLCGALVMALAGLLGSISGTGSFGDALPRILAESALAAGGTYFFREALSDGELSTETAETKRRAAVTVFTACALLAVSGVHIMSVISLGRLGALLVVMTAAFRGGSMAGAAAGTALGVAMDAASGGVPFYAMSYAFSGLAAGMFGKHGRLPCLLVFILADALAVLCAWAWTRQVNALFEVFAASVVFMIIPPTLLSRLGAVLQPIPEGAGESGLRRYAARRVDGIAKAYGDVCEVIKRATEPANDNDVAKVFDRAADVACVRCKKKNDCWNQNYLDTLDILNAASAAMSQRGKLEEGDLQSRFREQCSRLPEFIAAVNGELRAIAYRKQYRSRLEESRSAAWSQYGDFEDILKDVSRELGSMNGADPLAERRLLRYLRAQDIEADASVFRDSGGRLRAVIESGRLRPLTDDPAYLDKLSSVLGVRLCRPNVAGEGRLTLLEAEPLAVSVGIAAMRKRGESVNGDRGTYFKTDAGVLCVILSDGMGAGREAAKESIEAVAILEKFLRSGVEPAAAMKILNSVMLLRNGEEWGFATVDLMCVDLFSGEAGFYKYGAAPSYVRTGKTVRRITGESLAAGLITGEGAAPDVVRMKLRPGSVAVIASDGVIGVSGDSWLRDMLQKSADKDMKTLAREVLRGASDEESGLDDMTVLAVRVDARA
ncbi:MAG: SpoIIE family protein phosphatase [Oscillospiraceae bacterium]